MQYLECPAVPTTISGGGHEVSQVEWSFCFQGPKKNIIMKDTIGQAIVVSHMRALQQALVQNAEVGLIIVLERDIECNANTLFCSLALWPTGGGMST